MVLVREHYMGIGQEHVIVAQVQNLVLVELPLVHGNII